MTQRTNKIALITVICFVIGTLIGVLTYFGITGRDIISPIPSKAPFTISVEPSFIVEGQYMDPRGFSGQVPLKFTLTIDSKRNITYLALSKNPDSVVVDRENKNPQTKYANAIQWTKIANSGYVFYKTSNTIGYSNTQIAEGWLEGCQNCFMGEYAPYIFTFSVVYTENDGTKQTIPITVRLPIV